MTKIVFIGAGSLGFTRALVRDILTFPLLQNSELALVDINKQRLNFATRACRKIVGLSGHPAKVTATTDRREALKGADAVVVTILCGSVNIWKHDILIPKKYGIDINVGDTRGPSGIFRALRTIPTMLDICHDIEDLCPGAIMLNYTNPMAMLCNAMQRTTDVRVTGLCHSVQGTADMLAHWVGVKPDKLQYVCAGINHMSWYLKLERNGRNLYPKLRKVVEFNKDIYNQEQVRNEMFLALDYYVTESSGHNSEYNWWFRKRPDLIRKYCTHGTNWNPGKHAFIVKEYLKTAREWQKDARHYLRPETEVSLDRGKEYAAPIIAAFKGGEIYRFNGNVSNTGLIPNLPQGACVEVPLVVDTNGFFPMHVGPLPDSCAILTDLSARIEMMAVEGAISGNPRLVYQAIAHDPLTAAKLSLSEIKKMVTEMFRKNAKYLPQFKKIDL